MKNTLLNKFKKITSSMLALSMVVLNLAFIPAIQANGTTLTIGSQSALNGDGISVPITGDAFDTASNVFGVQFRVNYDNTLLQYVDYTEVTTGTVVNDNGTYISIVWDSATVLELDAQNFVILNFNVISEDNVNTNLTFSNTEVVDNAGDLVVVSFMDGVISLNSDETAPILAEETPVPTLTNDDTPDYTFSSTEAGTITYNGGCVSDTADATEGNNTITFNELDDGIYDSCTITVTDDDDNTSVPLAITTFTVDTAPPDITGLFIDDTPTQSKTWNWDSTDPTAKFRYAITQTIEWASFGEYSDVKTVTQDTGDGIYWLYVQAIDEAGNESNSTLVSAVLDNTPPTATLSGTPPNPTNQTTADIVVGNAIDTETVTHYKYSLDGGDYGDETPVNENIQLADLADGEYTLFVIGRDEAGNWQSEANPTEHTWTVDTVPDDITPPVRSNGQPSESLPPGNAGDVTSTTISLETNENATCKYSISPDANYDSMSYTFSTTGEKSHSTLVEDLSYGNAYNYYVRCKDEADNVNNDDFVISFVVPVIVDDTPPVLTEEIPVSTPTNDNTPNYLFNTNKAGTITYNGSCSSITTVAHFGYNIITFNELADGTYSDCVITVTDIDGNESLPLSVSAFTIDTTRETILSIGDIKVLPDQEVTVPIMIHNSPGIYYVEIKINYNPDIVRDTNITEGDFNNVFGVSGSTGGWATISGWATENLTGDLKVADVTFKARGNIGDSSLLDLEIIDLFSQTYGEIAMTVNDGTFTILETLNTTPPVCSDGLPTSALAAGTTQATLSLTTDENATCGYAVDAGTEYSEMTIFSVTDSTTHSTSITGLTNGSSYNYYVRCQDDSGNANTNDYTISFSVASPQNTGGGGGSYTLPTSQTANNNPLKIYSYQKGILNQDLNNENKVNVEIPKGSIKSTTTFTASEGSLEEGNVPKDKVGAFLFNGLVFNVEAVDSNKKAVRNFSEDLTITLTVPDLPDDTTTLELYYYDDANKEWIKITGVVFGKNTITFKVNHLTQFALFEIPEPIVKGVETTNIIDGDVVRVGDDEKVYVIKIINGKKFKRHIVSPEVFNSYGHLNWDMIKSVSSLDDYSLSAWVRNCTGPNGTPSATDKVYEVNGDSTMHWLNMTTQQFYAHGGSDEAIYNINQAELNLYTLGVDVMYQ